MPQTTAEWRAEASEVELRERATEMRKEWAELSKLDRSSDNYDKGKRQFVEEIEDLDMNLSIRQMQYPALRRTAPAGALDEAGGVEYRTAGQQLVDDEGFRSWMSKNAGREHVYGPSPSVEVRDLVSLGTSTNLTLPVLQPELIGIRRRKLFLRSLLGVAQVTQAAIPYIRELNATTNENAAAMFQEGGTTPKAQAKIEFTTDIAHVGVIAVNIPLTTQMLEDSTFLRSYVDTRLSYMLAIKEEDELLNGDGTGLNLRGILQTTGVQTQSAVSGETAITLMDAMVKIETRYGYADGIVMHPTDAAAMFTKRAAGGSGTFDAGTPFSDIPVNVWGMPVVRSLAMTAGTALVGNFQLGATILDRRSATINMYEQHADYVTLNRVLIQAEERVGLMVSNPDWFVTATIA